MAEEIRDFLVNSVSKTGGHLGASLGTVELNRAMHFIYDTPQDRIVWDAFATVMRAASSSFPNSASLLGSRSPAFKTPDWMWPCRYSNTRLYFAVACAGTGSGGGASLIAVLRGPAMHYPFLIRGAPALGLTLWFVDIHYNSA